MRNFIIATGCACNPKYWDFRPSRKALTHAHPKWWKPVRCQRSTRFTRASSKSTNFCLLPCDTSQEPRGPCSGCKDTRQGQHFCPEVRERHSKSQKIPSDILGILQGESLKPPFQGRKNHDSHKRNRIWRDFLHWIFRYFLQILGGSSW